MKTILELLKEMPEYNCHKVVRAAKITGYTGGNVFEVDNDIEISLTRKFMEKHAPQSGGYIVLYDNDYLSYSPAKAFEAGYKIKDLMSEIKPQAQERHSIGPLNSLSILKGIGIVGGGGSATSDKSEKSPKFENGTEVYFINNDHYLKGIVHNKPSLSGNDVRISMGVEGSCFYDSVEIKYVFEDLRELLEYAENNNIELFNSPVYKSPTFKKIESMINVKGWIEHLKGMSEKNIVLTINDHKMDNEKKSMICGVYIFLKHKRKVDKSFHNAVSDINGFIAHCGNEVDALLAHKYYVQCVRLKSYNLISQHTEFDEIKQQAQQRNTTLPLTVSVKDVSLFYKYRIKESSGKDMLHGSVMEFGNQIARGDFIKPSENSTKEYKVTKIVHLPSPELPELHIHYFGPF